MEPRHRPPAQLGKPVVDPADWQGTDLETRSDWRHVLSDAESHDLKAMAGQVVDRIGDDPNGLLTLTRADFNLGAFSRQIPWLRETLQDGLGVALIRGLPMDDLTSVEAAAVYWGIGANLGEARSNNPEGDMLGHVTDLGKSQDDPDSRGYQTRETMDYHCDQASIVGLLCVREPQSGGLSKVASSVAAYNTLLERSPETVELLSQRYCWTKHGEVEAGVSPYYESPILSVLDEKLCISFGPRHIVKGHLLPGAPALTPAQQAAIELMEQIADEQHFAMQLQRGDMQFLNNFVVLHTRTEYTDRPEPDRKRLLWRLWLSAPEIRPATDYVKQWDAGVTLSQTRPRIRL